MITISTAKRIERERLARDTEAFQKAGGEVKQLHSHQSRAIGGGSWHDLSVQGYEQRVATQNDG